MNSFTFRYQHILNFLLLPFSSQPAPEPSSDLPPLLVLPLPWSLPVLESVREFRESAARGWTKIVAGIRAADSEKNFDLKNN